MMEQQTKLIGYGNELRGDDAAGLEVAKQFAAWNFPGLQIIATPQLYPELACDIATCMQVIFVDAEAAAFSAQKVRIRELANAANPPVFGHAYSPGRIIEIVHRLYDASPKAWVVTVPGIDFSWKEGLSPTTSAAIPSAIETIVKLLKSQGVPGKGDRRRSTLCERD